LEGNISRKDAKPQRKKRSKAHCVLAAEREPLLFMFTLTPPRLGFLCVLASLREPFLFSHHAATSASMAILSYESLADIEGFGEHYGYGVNKS